jgi:hypothetical protein
VSRRWSVPSVFIVQAFSSTKPSSSTWRVNTMREPSGV